MQGLCVIGNFIPITQNAPQGCAHFILYRNENQVTKGLIARMKRIKKQVVLEAITLLENANEYVTADLQPEELMNILTQCQEAAILTGNDLETQGESTKELITMLEEYCELIFQISRSMDDPENRRQLAQTVRNLLIRLHSKTVELLPEDRKEIVFLPYKASMWDSLESVWKAADADPECDAYVIPIPYYDKNSDGSFREMHYEGDLFPDNVPITRYDAYSLEERRPDAIYIHNPYDGANYVTSVHPDYYSDKLKQYTDELVYIPYFVLNEVNPEDNNALESIEHFILTPAVIHATKVIVQSENMRKCYIKSLVKAFGEQTRDIWEKKILGTGSPKFDKIIHLKKEEVQIPENWLKYIIKPDGSRKKIVFYNTSVTALLQNDEKMLIKMKQVFETFKAYKDDIALLWRPHPLIESTLLSMRPQLYEAYEKIKNQYIEEDWGIYDDTPDMDRAVAMSDAYYGDQSSVVQLCQKREMPIMIQNVVVNNSKKNALATEDNMYWHLNACCMACDENGVWFVEGMCPILYLYDNREKRVTYSKVLQIDKGYGTAYFSELYNDGDFLYLIPNNSSQIVSFNKITRKCEYWDVKEKPQNLFKNCYKYNNVLYCIPYKSKNIYKIDIRTQRIIGAIKCKYNCEKEQCINSSCRIENKIYCILWKSNRIVVFDLESEQEKIIRIPSEYKITSVCRVRENICFYDIASKSIILFDINNNSVLETKFLGLRDVNLFSDNDSKVIVDDYEMTRGKLVDYNKNTIVDLNFPIQNYNCEISPWKIGSWYVDEGKIIWGITVDGVLIRISADGIRQTNLEVKLRKYLDINKRMNENVINRYYEERYLYSLTEFMDKVRRAK